MGASREKKKKKSKERPSGHRLSPRLGFKKAHQPPWGGPTIFELERSRGLKNCTRRKKEKHDAGRSGMALDRRRLLDPSYLIQLIQERKRA